MRIVVVGGVAAGMSAASQAKRRRPEAEVVVLERGPHISYGGCGMPYNLEDPARSMDDLVVVSADSARRERGLDVRLRHEVAALDPAARRVGVRDLEAGRAYELDYDALVLATGASAVKPRLPGVDLPGVFVLRELADGAALKRHLADARPRSAVIVGAGYIGMEMAEALRARGLGVSVLEKLDQVLPGFDPRLAALVHDELRRHEVGVHTGVAVQSFGPGTAGALEVRTGTGVHAADLVLVSIGVRPNVALARAAGIPLGESGAIAVDDGQRTGLAGIFAAGDCAEARHVVSRRPAYVPLGTTANKQGKVAGANAAGGDERFAGIAGTAAFKVFDLEVGRTGLGLAEAQRLGLDAVSALSRQASRAHSFDGDAPQLGTLVVAERGSGRLLGAQMAGVASAGAVAKRIDVFAAALFAGFTVEQVEGLDLSYAPPFAPVYDPVLIAATVARKELAKPAAETAGVHGGR